MRKLNRIIVHCTATKPEWMEDKDVHAKVAEINRWHTSPPLNWKKIGYHYLVDRDGTVVACRPVEEVGAHVKGHNADSIGIALVGGFGSSADDEPEDNYPSVQLEALRSLITSLQNKHGDLAVSGHNRYANKACPGFRAAKWWAAPTYAEVPGLGSVATGAAVLMTDGWVQYAMIGVTVAGIAYAAYRWWRGRQ